jgi:glutamate decarboxylase
MEVTENLVSKASSAHALNMLGHAQRGRTKQEHHEGGLEMGEGSVSSGTYAKTC